MTTIFCDGNYIVADKLSTCSRAINNRHVDSTTSSTNYRFGVQDSVKVGKIKGLSVKGKLVKAVAIGGSATDAGDFLRDLRDYIKIGTSKENPTVDLEIFLRVRGVFKVPFTGNFSILFLTENKHVIILRISSSTRKTRDADGVAYSTEMVRFKIHDLSTGKGELVGIGSGWGFYSELDGFIDGDHPPHILDAYCYCVNRDHEHSSRSFSVYSLELDHADDAVDFTQQQFEERLNRFVSRLNLTRQFYGSLPVARRIDVGE